LRARPRRFDEKLPQLYGGEERVGRLTGSLNLRKKKTKALREKRKRGYEGILLR